MNIADIPVTTLVLDPSSTTMSTPVDKGERIMTETDPPRERREAHHTCECGHQWAWHLAADGCEWCSCKESPDD